MKYCEICGKEFGDGVSFCPSCGAKLSERAQGFIDLDETTETSVPTAPSVSTVPAVQPGQPPVPTMTSNAPPDAIVLKSSAPIPSKTGWTKWGYIASLVLAVVTAGVGLLGVFFVFIIEHFQMDHHRGKIRRIKFKFVDRASSDDIYNRLQPVLSRKYGDKMEIDREGDTIAVHYNSIIYDINLNGDSTFCVWWRKSIAGAFFSFNEWKLYKKVRTGTAIIAYELQQAFGIK